MINFIHSERIYKMITVNANSQLVLIDGFDPIFDGKPSEKSRNIFLINSKQEVIWRIFSKNDNFGDSFTNIYEENRQFKAYRWDGGQYDINIKTGEAIPGKLLK
ncbi:hypothetical protein PT273_01165 [Orbaceae bacterium ESL0727]|nr:hypothetical protein [Orbaceae bacterium ESL0727]